MIFGKHKRTFGKHKRERLERPFRWIFCERKRKTHFLVSFIPSLHSLAFNLMAKTQISFIYFVFLSYYQSIYLFCSFFLFFFLKSESKGGNVFKREVKRKKIHCLDFPIIMDQMFSHHNIYIIYIYIKLRV